MNNRRVDEIKKEDKKAFKCFLMIIIISAIVGWILGSLSGNLKEILGNGMQKLIMNIFVIITPFANLVISMLVIIVSKIIYSDLRKKYDLWKEKNEDDNTIDKIELKMYYLKLLNSINTILGFFFMAIGSMLKPFDNLDGSLNNTKVICFLIGFILCITTSTLIQKKIINLEKEINPLLKGSIYDVKFTKKWIDSCDEAIKLGIFKSAYKAFSSVSITCLILWLFCILGYDLWNFGIMPMVMVTIIWLVQTISYCRESIKQ
ncbi:Protein of uncharacterised function (DUF3169) [[Clostridium] sordellii]|uniref:DUF3169 family protein n=1 Tax=Paraclostridium sordellii TaxID=1505 RepID=UPI0005DFBA48|nr:DUF3169 family protein [Paeniclostridium sordellii]CEN76168.1 Protein of uncharacterised function (DUF3169) [[Clostridium] sordellii] [Paeniclostridium sordellii]